MSESREEVLSRNAFRFAKSYYDNFASKGVTMTPAERQAFNKGENAYVDWAAGAMYARMAADPEYSADNWDDAKGERLDKYKDVDGALYAFHGNKSPEQDNYDKRWEKFRPLVENGAWYSKGAKELDEDMVRLGYDPKSKTSKNQFFTELSRYDQDYNRAKNVDEFANSGWGKYASVMSPTAYKEAVEQALTDRPYSEFDVWTAHGIDQVRSALTGRAMGLQGVVRPAIGMGLADALSQYADAAALGHRDFSPEEILGAASAGATIVPGFRMATKWMSRLKSPAAQKIGREMYRGARNYQGRDAVAEEANALKEQLLQARKAQRVLATEPAGTPKHDAAQKVEGEMEDKLRLLGFTGDLNSASPARTLEEMSGNSYNNVAEGRLYSINQMLGREGHPRPITDEQAVNILLEAYNDPRTFNVNRPTLEEAARRLAGRNLGYSNDQMDAYNIVKNFGRENASAVLGGDVRRIGSGMETAVENEAGRLIGNGEAASYLDQILRNASERRAGLEGAFPKVSAKYSGNAEKKARTGWSMAGAYGANTLGLISGAKGVDLIGTVRGVGSAYSGNSAFQDKIDAFKRTEWYRGLPEEKKNTVEAAFKKAMEERKEKN